LSKDDQDALWEHLDAIDCFASAHDPHTLAEKLDEHSPGFPSLETTVPLLLTAVSQGRLTVEQLTEKMYTNPRKIFGLPTQPDTYIDVDLDERWTIPDAMPHSRCGWTPFAGFKVTGRVQRVVVRGKTAFLDGQVTAACGSGEDVRQSSDFLATALAETGASKLGSGQSLARMPASDRVPLSPRREQIRRPAAGSVGTGGSDYHVLPPPVELDNLTVSMRLPFKHILSVKQWDKALLYRLFQVATQMRMHVKSDRGGTDLLKGRVLASVFYEPSTRTSCSFIAAMQRLGGSVITLHDVANTSVSKGESLADTMRTMEALCDVTVMRHPGKNSVAEVAAMCRKPVINGGDGTGEHPSQALLDAFTIREELGTLNGAAFAPCHKLLQTNVATKTPRLCPQVSPSRLSATLRMAERSTRWLNW